MNATLIILALAAAFLGYRLYSVLGKRGGHEQTGLLNPTREQPSTVPMVRPLVKPNAPPTVGGRDTGDELYEPAAEAGLRAIMVADRSFSVGAFVDGARGAYRMILEAYWQDDRDLLQSLTDADMFAAFVELIEERAARGETLDNRLVTIEQATITQADLDRGIARIAVRFDADIAAVTRDAEGNMVAGSLSDATQTHDIWTFTRALDSRNPNWVLEETDEA